MIHILVDKCQHEGCNLPVKTLVATHDHGLKALCQKHYEEANNEIWKRFEYIIACPNCYCVIGVG